MPETPENSEAEELAIQRWIQSTKGRTKIENIKEVAELGNGTRVSVHINDVNAQLERFLYLILHS